MKLARLFQDHMVIQRGKPFLIWGTGEEGETVTVTIGQDKQTVRTNGGRWKIEFPPISTEKGMTITVESENGQEVIRDVVSGEVWIAGGQSNMEFQMLFDADHENETALCGNTDIRFFDYPEVSYEGQEEDFDYSQMGYWRTCTSENLKYFSAVAYYFGKKLNRDLNVPIGIIGCNWGGTTASCWMSEEYLRRHGQIWIDEYKRTILKIKDLEEYKNIFRKSGRNNRGQPFEDEFTMWVMPGISREEQLKIKEDNSVAEAMESGPFGPRRPCGLYETMLSHIAGYSVRGVIWYQGESDVLHADIYKDVFLDLVQCWRELWKEDLPFITVQLAPFEAWLDLEGTEFPMIRRQQRRAADERGIYMVSTSDAGMRYDIHPKRKKPIGQRGALLAEEKIYGMDILGQAPEGRRAEESDDGIMIRFAHAGEGLILKGETLNALKVKRQDGTWAKILSCSVEKETLRIRLDHKKTGKHVIEFAQTPYYEVNLYNSSDIPAIPFLLEVFIK